jgi:hypothetical protein
MQGLDRIFARPSQLTVLRVLYRSDTPLNGREIERRCGLSNRATMMALESLTDMSAVHRDPSGNAYWYQLNNNHYLVAKMLKQAFEAEELFWVDFGKTVRRKVQPRPIAAVATGPLTRDESLSEGRIDLVMVFSTGRNRIRAYPALAILAEAIHERYGLEVEPTLLDVNTMDRSENDALWRRVEREGILLFGTLP